jgi:hypothetical protein
MCYCAQDISYVKKAWPNSPLTKSVSVRLGEQFLEQSIDPGMAETPGLATLLRKMFEVALKCGSSECLQ